MYDHELSVAIQQERERAIREARMHHRHDLIREPSWLAKLVAAIHPARVGQTPSANPTGSITTPTSVTPSSPARPCAGGSTTVTS